MSFSMFCADGEEAVLALVVLRITCIYAGMLNERMQDACACLHDLAPSG